MDSPQGATQGNGPLILLGLVTSQGTQVAFCLADHHWYFGPAIGAKKWAYFHSSRDHGIPTTNVIQAPKGIPYRPVPLDKLGI